ncbi:MFS transporter [Peribacillus frigoritolerans]|nr:MFS transporter [Peribacillus frigoritolerans]
MGLGGELPVASTLVSESVEASKRGRVVVLLESFWAVGWILAALISYFIIPAYGWRVALLLSAVPALYALYLRLKLPDSPKYTELEKKAKTICIKQYEKCLEKGILPSDPCIVDSMVLRGLFLLWDVFMAAKRDGPKGFSMIQSFEYVLIMTLAQLPGYFSAAWLIEKMGRKFVLITYLIGTAVSAFFLWIGRGAGTADQFPGCSYLSST